jgi:hypothetical protein
MLRGLVTSSKPVPSGKNKAAFASSLKRRR